VCTQICFPRSFLSSFSHLEWNNADMMVPRLTTNIKAALSKLPVAELAALVLEPTYQASRDRIVQADKIKNEADQRFFCSVEEHDVLKALRSDMKPYVYHFGQTNGGDSWSGHSIGGTFQYGTLTIAHYAPLECLGQQLLFEPGKACFTTDIWRLQGHTNDVSITSSAISLVSNWIQMPMLDVHAHPCSIGSEGRDSALALGNAQGDIWNMNKQRIRGCLEAAATAHSMVQVVGDEPRRTIVKLLDEMLAEGWQVQHIRHAMSFPGFSSEKIQKEAESTVERPLVSAGFAFCRVSGVEPIPTVGILARVGRSTGPRGCSICTAHMCPLLYRR